MGTVATERGGQLRGVPGAAGHRSLSWAELDGIIQRFEQRKPYDAGDSVNFISPHTDGWGFRGQNYHMLRRAVTR